MAPVQSESTSLPAREAFVMTAIAKAYPGVTALSDVDLVGYAGEVLAICGANGAGKSTLARLLAGQERATSGGIAIAGYSGSVKKPADAEAAGVLLMHQEPLIVDHFSVEENVWLKRLSTSDGVKPWQLIPRKRGVRTREALSAVGLGGIDLAMAASELGPGPRQMLALSRTQVNPHRILLLDETTASTTEDHFRDVLELVDRERAAGVCVVFVSHRMPEVFAMADRIAVLRNGKLMDVVRTSQTTPDDVLTLMIGEAVSALEPLDLEAAPGETPVLQVEGLAAGSATGINLELKPGEVVGLYGLVGSGRSSIARSIAGHQPRLSGQIRLRGVDVSPHTPRQALRLGIAYLTEDRRKEGFVRGFTNGRNLTLSTLGKNSRLGILNRRRETSRQRGLIDRYQVKGGIDTYTRSLSGGNQQKVAIAKWLEAEPDVMILDEPTKGIDVGARLNIYEIIRTLAATGKGVLVITSEAEEALKLCSRVLILRDGRMVSEVHPATSTTDDLIRASLGGDSA